MEKRAIIPMMGDYGKIFDRLTKAGIRVDNLPIPTESLSETAEFLSGYTYIVTGGEKWPAGLLEKLGGHTKMLVKFGVGVDNIDLAAAKENGIAVSNTPGANSFAVAELAAALILGISRGVSAYDSLLKSGGWQGSVPCASLRGKVVGLLGFGSIAQQLASLLLPFGTAVIACDPVRNGALAASLGVRYTSLEELFASSDFLSLHIPLTENTRHFISAKELARMKPGAFLINTSRGGVVREEDLVRALENGVIAGAGLDVYEEEPLPADSPLRRLKNVVLTPHVAAGTAEAYCAMMESCVDNILAFEQGIARNRVITS